jgi:hypothetical protein
MRRRTLIIIASIIVVIGAAIGLYFLFANNSSELEVGNPFDGLGAGDASPNSDLPTGVPINDAGEEIAPRLVRIAEGPIVPETAAFTVTATSTGTTSPATEPDTEIRFIERASGNVYAYRAHERTLTRLSNRTLPGIQEASWLTDGSMAYVRFLTSTPDGEVVDTYALQAEGAEGYFLEKGLSIVETHGTRLLFTLLGSSTGSTGTIAAARGAAAPKTLFTSPLASIRFYLADNRYFAATRASAQLDGYAFIVSPVSGTFSRVIGPYRGLTILPSPSGNNVLYSFMDRGTLRLGIIDIETRTATPLPVATFADKCVWSLDERHIYCGVPRALTGSLPDEWYQGVVGFNDRIWSIDLAVRVATLVIDPTEVAETNIDAIGLTLDAQDDMLTFVDRVTGALYTYDL